MSDSRTSANFRVIGGADSARLVFTTAEAPEQTARDEQEISLAEARTEAYRQGRADAEAEAAAQMGQLQQTVEQLADRLPAAWEATIDALEQRFVNAAIELAFSVAEEVTRNCGLGTAAARTAIEEALELPLLGDRIEVRCCPEDLAVLRSDGTCAEDARLTLVPDAKLAPGDVWVVTPRNGELDGRLSQRLQALKEALARQLTPGSESDAGTTAEPPQRNPETGALEA
jgi:flagellar biosynthesis/type III secretory pathway protein FliH